MYRLHMGPHRFVTGSVGPPADGTVQWVNNAALEFLPVPNKRYAVQVFYVPKPRLLANDTDVFAYGHEKWIVADCAARCKEKQESDSSVLRARVAAVRDRITNDARTPDAGQVPQVVDVYGSNRSRGSYRGEPEEC
jgi:hypothetical protein